MTIRQIMQFVLSCNYSDPLAGLCKAQLRVEAYSPEAAASEARAAGWESVLSRDLCAAHKGKPEHGCPKDGTRLTIQGGIRRCQRDHGYLRGQLVVMSA